MKRRLKYSLWHIIPIIGNANMNLLKGKDNGLIYNVQPTTRPPYCGLNTTLKSGPLTILSSLVGNIEKVLECFNSGVLPQEFALPLGTFSFKICQQPSFSSCLPDSVHRLVLSRYVLSSKENIDLNTSQSVSCLQTVCNAILQNNSFTSQSNVLLKHCFGI